MRLLPYLLLIITLCASEDLYHEPSALVFKPSTLIKNDSLFGFSVAYTSYNQSRIIVGAPKMGSLGQIFECPLNDGRACNPTHMPEGINFGSQTKHEVWFGASVSAGPSFYVACAPRCYDSYRPVRHKWWGVRKGTFGMCVVGGRVEPPRAMMRMTHADREKKYSKFEKSIDGLGWSSFVSKNGDVLVGGPPMGTGKFVVYGSPLENNNVPVVVSNTLNDVQFNLGYSVVSGNFLSNDFKEEVYAVSTTYGVDGVGKVFLVDKRAKVLRTISDDKGNVGAMFGASLCAADLDGDSQAELIVGAPAHTSNALLYDTGALHVYRGGPSSMVHLNTIAGSQEGSYFGFAIANVGDLNGDGCHDVAVSAPQEDGGRGVVYIFSGRSLADGRPTKPLQRIKAPDASTRSFGLSLATVTDYDDNGCNELAVGAAYSNLVVVYRCFFVINVQPRAVFPDLSALAVDTATFTFQSCINVTYPEKPVDVVANVNVTVEIIHKAARLANRTASGTFEYTVTLNTKLAEYCEPIVVNTDKAGDFSDLFQYKISAAQNDDPRQKTDFDSTKAVVPSRSVHGSVPCSRRCSTVGCKPRLAMALNWTLSATYLIGSTERENVSVRVRNTGDSAYGTCVRLRVVGAPVWAAPQTCVRDSQQHYTCELRAPLHNNAVWDMGHLILDMNQLSNMDRSVRVEARLHEKCDSSHVNSSALEAGLYSDVKGIIVNGWTDHETDIYFTTSRLRSDEHSLITHIYEVSNIGVTKWLDLHFNLMLEVQPYLEYDSIKIYTDASEVMSCPLPTMEPEMNTPNVLCSLDRELAPKFKRSIYLRIRLIPRRLESFLHGANVTVSSKISLKVEDQSKSFSLSTAISLHEELVPVWLIALGVLLGLLLLVLFVYGLRTMGFFGRKNRVKLETYKSNMRPTSLECAMATVALQAAATANERRFVPTHQDKEKPLDGGCDEDDLVVLRNERKIC